MKKLTKAQRRVLRCLAKDDSPNFCSTYRIYRDHYPIVKKLVKRGYAARQERQWSKTHWTSCVLPTAKGYAALGVETTVTA